MAEILKSFAFPRIIMRYPWGEWEDGQIRKVKRGTDFVIRANSFRQILINKARELNKRVHTDIVDENTVIFQFYKPNDQ